MREEPEQLLQRIFLVVRDMRLLIMWVLDTVDDGVEMAVNSEVEIVVVCSSDEEYKELVPEISAKIREKVKNTIIIVAGFPAEIVEDLKEIGVDDFIFLKSNTFEILTKYQKKLGVMNS